VKEVVYNIIHNMKRWVLEHVQMDMLSANPKAISYLESNPDIINWDELSDNPEAISLLECNQDKINWTVLSRNPKAMQLLEVNGHKIDWNELSKNPSAIHILTNALFQENINWMGLSENPAAMKLLEANVSNIHWGALSKNPSAIPLLYKHVDKIDPWYISTNPNAMPLLQEYPHLIHWGGLSQNPNAIPMLEANMEKINWNELSKNPNALHLLKRNVHRINGYNLATNPSIFVPESDDLVDYLQSKTIGELREICMENNMGPTYKQKDNIVQDLVATMQTIRGALAQLGRQELSDMCADYGVESNLELLVHYLVTNNIYNVEVKQKSKRTTIPKQVKTEVWREHIGYDIPYHKCLCCKKVTIYMNDFMVGYIKNDGLPSVANLLPICVSCHVNINTMNMDEFIKMYHYYC